MRKVFSIAIFLLGVLLFIQCERNAVEVSELTNVTPLTNSWEVAIPNQEVPAGLSSLSAKQCGSCHQDHYNEWKLSTHSHAWTDLQFQAELKKESSPFMCINCHIPLQNQQEYIIKGLENGDIYKPVKERNPLFDRELQQEGINCASCHVRDGAVIGPTGTEKAPHKTVKDPSFLSEALCISCHNAVAVVTPTLACSFETGDEWKEGPHFGEKNCIDCHMEKINREIVHGYGERLSHFHSFPGSGIPKFDTVKSIGLNGLGIYPSKIDSVLNIGDSVSYTLKLKNEFAGHKLPTGDPERFFLITFSLVNETGDTLVTKQDRIGEHWEWYPEAKKISDNNLMPNEERVFSFSYKPKMKENLRLEVAITKNRMDNKTALYNKLGANYPLFITVFKRGYSINIK